MNNSYCINWTNLIDSKMYYLMSSIIFKSCLKLITHLVSKTWMLMLLKISSKVFYGDVLCVVKWIGCLLVINWFTSFGKITQFEWNGPFELMGACDVELLPYNSLIVWTKESCICSFVYQLAIAFVFTNSHFISTCCYGIGYVWWQQLHLLVHN